MSKEAILQRVREGVAHIKRVQTPPSPIDIKEYIKNDGDLYENFKTNSSNNKAIIYECETGNLQEKIGEILAQIGTKRLMFGDNLPIDPQLYDVEKLHFNKSVNELYSELFETDTAVIEAKIGISNLGVLCITSSSSQPRLLSLLPTHCIILLKKDSIVESLNDAFKEAVKDGLPSNIIFVIGPSRTSDIELQVVLGVHGPQNLYVVLY